MDGPLDAKSLGNLFDAMATGLMAVDVHGVVTAWNAEAERITGRTRDEVVGKRCDELDGFAHPCRSCSGKEAMCPLFDCGELSNVECRIVAKDGREVVLLKNARVMRDSAGLAIGGVETFSDVTAFSVGKRDMEPPTREFTRRYRLHGLIGKSESMQSAYELIEQAARTNATVLVNGESGTGKDLVARAIHFLSPRAKKAFVRVSCSALAETLLESEIFGHVRGSFTHAFTDKIGRFEAADGGTIFLGEIGEVSANTQVKLLRVLQEREFERVGETRTRKVDVRVVAATNRDLRQLVKEGKFREDLYYRLKVVPVALPPLRDRKEDVPLLINHFLEKYSTAFGKRITGCSREVMSQFLDYRWPGNVRELEHAIEHAFVVSQGTEISIFDLPEELRRRELEPLMAKHRRERPRDPNEELALIQRVLADTGGNRAKAARVLGISRVTLWKRLRRLGAGATGHPPSEALA